MVRGSCLCGEVAWEAAPPFELMTHCHCSLCRKAHGAAFATFVAAPVAGFRFVRGEAGISRYESSPGFLRSFCGRCGSAVPSVEEGERIFLPAGCLDDDPGVRPLAHIFVGSMAPWHALSDALPRFETMPPGMGGERVPSPVRGPAPPGRVRGSCLCGASAFELATPLGEMRSCHCSRCRKARAAAHGTNVFARLEALHWVRGEERVRSFHVPGAQFFTNCFCPTCGAKLPRADASRGLAVVPASSLDDDPGVRPAMHVFVGSKAPWFELTDALPRHDAAAPTPPRT